MLAFLGAFDKFPELKIPEIDAPRSLDELFRGGVLSTFHCKFSSIMKDTKSSAFLSLGLENVTEVFQW